MSFNPKSKTNASYCLLKTNNSYYVLIILRLLRKNMIGACIQVNGYYCLIALMISCFSTVVAMVLLMNCLHCIWDCGWFLESGLG